MLKLILGVIVNEDGKRVDGIEKGWRMVMGEKNREYENDIKVGRSEYKSTDIIIYVLQMYYQHYICIACIT